jgi:hypothetical protein
MARLLVMIAALVPASGCGEPPGPEPDERVSITVQNPPTSGTVATTLEVTVSVTGNNGRPLANVLVRGFADSISGSVTNSTTNSRGLTTLLWTLGNRATLQSVRLTAGERAGNSFAFTLAARAGPPEKFDVLTLPPLSVGDTQPLPSNGALDRYDNPVTEVVQWTSVLNDGITLLAGGNVVGNRPGSSQLRLTVNGVSLVTTINVQPFRLRRYATPREVRRLAGTDGNMVAAVANGTLWQTTSGWSFDSIPNLRDVIPAPQGLATWALTSSGSTYRLRRYTAPGTYTEFTPPDTTSFIAGAFGDTVILNGQRDSVWVGPFPWRLISGRGMVVILAQTPSRFIGYNYSSAGGVPRFIVARYDGMRWQHDTTHSTPMTHNRLAVSRNRAYLLEWRPGTSGSRSHSVTRIDPRPHVSRQFVSCSFGTPFSPCWHNYGLGGDEQPFLTGSCTSSGCYPRFVGFLKLQESGDVPFYFAVRDTPGTMSPLDGGPAGCTSLAVNDHRGLGVLIVCPATP